MFLYMASPTSRVRIWSDSYVDAQNTELWPFHMLKVYTFAHKITSDPYYGRVGSHMSKIKHFLKFPFKRSLKYVYIQTGRINEYSAL